MCYVYGDLESVAVMSFNQTSDGGKGNWSPYHIKRSQPEGTIVSMRCRPPVVSTESTDSCPRTHPRDLHSITDRERHRYADFKDPLTVHYPESVPSYTSGRIYTTMPFPLSHNTHPVCVCWQKHSTAQTRSNEVRSNENNLTQESDKSVFCL